MTQTIAITIPEDAWEPCGWCDTSRDRLLAQVVIGGTHHHLEAYRVETGMDGIQRLADPVMDDELGPTLQSLHAGCYDTVKIRGDEYALFMFPHAD